MLNYSNRLYIRIVSNCELYKVDNKFNFKVFSIIDFTENRFFGDVYDVLDTNINWNCIGRTEYGK